MSRVSYLLTALVVLVSTGVGQARAEAGGTMAGADQIESALLLRSAMLAGDWLVNNQNKKQLWGSAPFSGDYGRFVYEYRPGDGFWRGGVCWTTATGIMGLVSLYNRTGLEKYSEAALRAGGFLKSLQCLDSRKRRTYGAMREITQQDDYIFPRDGMTSTGGFMALYFHTGEKEYLERARLYADWYLANAINPATGWPLWSFPLERDELNESDKKMGVFPGRWRYFPLPALQADRGHKVPRRHDSSGRQADRILHRGRQ